MLGGTSANLIRENAERQISASTRSGHSGRNTGHQAGGLPLRTKTLADGTTLARISHTLADAGLVLAAPTGFRVLLMHPLGEYTRYWRRHENLAARQCPAPSFRNGMRNAPCCIANPLNHRGLRRISAGTSITCGFTGASAKTAPGADALRDAQLFPSASRDASMTGSGWQSDRQAIKFLTQRSR
jgi:hypothetical protein